MAGRTFPTGVRLAAFRLAVFGLAVGLVGCRGVIHVVPVPPPLRITVDRRRDVVPPGSTFGEVIARRHLHARSGRLLSVTGTVLDAAVDPGRIELNGVPARRSTALADGDRISVIDGTDRTEPVTRRRTRLSGTHPGDPERTLAVYPIDRISAFGRISGDIVSVRDDTVGRGVTPRAVALTFDDGPWPVATGKVIGILKHFHVPATFFMVGYLVRRYPSIVRSVEKAGYEIGDHSWDHPLSPPLAALPPAKLRSEIALTAAALKQEGVTPTLFRPPGGSYDDGVIQEARLQGMRVVLWSVDPQDWRSGLTPKKVTRAVLSHVQAGSIVLLHDGGGDAAHTIAALPAIIRGIRKRGLGFATVPPGP